MSSLPGRGMTSSQPPLGDWLRDPDIEVMKRPDRRTVVLRRIDLWSALKVSLGLYFSLFLVALAALMLLWLAARSTGFLDNVYLLVLLYTLPIVTGILSILALHSRFPLLTLDISTKVVDFLGRPFDGVRRRLRDAIPAPGE